jgi:hypothetical protein
MTRSFDLSHRLLVTANVSIEVVSSSRVPAMGVESVLASDIASWGWVKLLHYTHAGSSISIKISKKAPIFTNRTSPPHGMFAPLMETNQAV